MSLAVVVIVSFYIAIAFTVTARFPGFAGVITFDQSCFVAARVKCGIRCIIQNIESERELINHVIIFDKITKLILHLNYL